VATVRGIEDPRLRDPAIRIVEGIVDRANLGQRFHPVDLIALLGASEQTLRLLEAQPDWYLQVDRPEFDVVRDDLRFKALMAPLRTSGSGPRGCPARGRGSREA
jgi:hypothetical protein